MAGQEKKQEVSKEQLRAELSILGQVVNRLEQKNGHLQGYITRLEVEKESLSSYVQQLQESDKEE